MDKENDLSLVLDDQPTPQAKSTELINRKRPVTMLRDASNPKMPDLSSLSDISTISELKLDDSNISVQAGHKETPRLVQFTLIFNGIFVRPVFDETNLVNFKKAVNSVLF